MPYLSGFQYDIFLSYGWAGNRRPDEGDRGWVSRFAKLLAEHLTTPLGRAVNIFIDSKAERSGRLTGELEEAIDQSALLLFAVSPGSCRPDSWCHFELRHFLGRATPIVTKDDVLTPEERLFGAMFHPVPLDERPAALRGMGFRTYEFYEEIHGAPRPLDLTGDEPEFVQLVHAIANRLKQSKKMLEHPREKSGKTVFLGSAPNSAIEDRDLAKMRRELLLAGHRVISDDLTTADDRDNYLRRLEDHMGEAALTVHMISEKSPLREGWNESAIALQLRKAALMSRNRTEFSFFAWVDPDARQVDPLAKAELPPELLSKGDHLLVGMNFQTFLSVVQQRLETQAPAPVSVEQEKVVVVAFCNEDIDLAGGVVRYLQGKGLQTQLTAPPGRRGSSDLNNGFFKKHPGVVVCFGASPEDWVLDTCDNVREVMSPGGQRALLIGPPDENPPIKKIMNTERQFDCLRVPGEDFQLLDPWIQRLRGGAGPAVRAAAGD